MMYLSNNTNIYTYTICIVYILLSVYRVELGLFFDLFLIIKLMLYKNFSALSKLSFAGVKFAWGSFL